MRYFIVDESAKTNIDFTNSPNRENTVRYNLNRDKFIVKYQTRDVPASLSQNNTAYTQNEILEIINNPENRWVDEI